MQDVLIGRPESIQEILVNATRALGMTMEYRDARLQAELLLAHALGTTRTLVLARLGDRIDAETAARYAANVARRAKHEPLAYILGHQEFYQLDFIVDRRVLIPRHETEMLVQLALESAKHVAHPNPVVVDVGTGSGALALSIAHNLPGARVLALDTSPDALAVAQLNADRLNLNQNVEFRKSDLLAACDEPFDILVANLPYIPSGRYSDLPVEVRRFEPRIALDGGLDGFGVMRRLLGQLQSHAQANAVAFLEISEEQGSAALELTQQTLPFALVSLHKDLEGLDRVVQIQLNRGNISPASQIVIAHYSGHRR